MALSAETYIKQSIKGIERQLDAELGKSSTPMAEGDHPKLDDSPLCTSAEGTIYRSMIGSANWIVTLGRFDIAFALQSLARYSMAPRVGHLVRLKKLFCYLKTRPTGKLLCDASYSDHTQYEIANHNWSDIYPDAGEEIPANMPTPKGRPVRMTCYVDADHAHCQAIR